MSMFADMEKWINREELGSSGVKLLLLESCGDVALSDYLHGVGDAEDAHAILFMLFHALSYMRGYKMSHNDLHAGNIMVSSTAPTRLSFGERRFLTSTTVRIIDWDLGRSDSTPNESLVDYEGVGIFNRFNALFDVVGLMKTIAHQHCVHTDPMCRARGPSFSRALGVMQVLFEPVRKKHSWLFKEHHELGGNKKKIHLVQQTIFSPNGIVEEKWPSKVFSDAPSIQTIIESLYDDMTPSRKQFVGAPAYSFPSNLLY